MSPEGKKFHFDVEVEEFPDSVLVGLPEQVERDIAKESLNSPLSITRRMLLEAEIPDEEVERYVQAVWEFAGRKSVVELNKEGAFGFAPQEMYFGSHVIFSQQVSAMPDLLKNGPFKPHFGKKEGFTLSTKTIDGEKVLESIVGASENHKDPTAFEKTLVVLNRLMYRFHEPIHINQGLAPGDRFNRLKDHIVLEDLVDTEHVTAYLREHTSMGDGFEISKADWMDESLLIMPNPLEDSEKSIYWTDLLIANNEATMDILADDAVSGYLRSNPETMVWLHNTLAYYMEGLRTLKERLSKDFDRDDSTQEEMNKKILQEIKSSLGFLTRPYFAAFESSLEAEEFLQNSHSKKLGRNVSGEIAKVAPFDYAEVLNIMGDIEKLMYFQYAVHDHAPGKPKRFLGTTVADLATHTFPSGVTHFLASEKTADRYIPQSDPITHDGIYNTASLFASMVEKGFSKDVIKNTLEGINDFLDQEDEEGLIRAKEKLQKEYSIEISITDLKEMYRVYEYLYFDELLDANYPYNFLVRKEVLKKLKTVAPEEAHKLIRGMFSFEAQTSKIDTFLLTGFGRYVKGKLVIRLWEEIKNDKELGIFNLDVPRLSKDQQQEMETIYQELNKEADGVDYEDLIAKVADIKRQQ